MIRARLHSLYMRAVAAARGLHSLYMRLMGRRQWQAASPAGALPLGFLTDREALEAGHKLGRVSYVDRERCVIFFDTHLGSQITERI